MPLAPMTHAPRVLNIPLAATAVAPVLCRNEPFAPGQSVLASSAGASQIFGASSPAGDRTRQLKFQVAAADIIVAASTLAQVAAARDAAGNVTGDLTITLGTAGGRLGLAVIPLGAIAAGTLLSCIVLVNGVPYAKITDANAPNPGVGQFGLDDNTDAGYTLVIGASTGTDAILIGTEIEILLPEAAVLLSKSNNGTGAALVASVLEERLIGVPISYTDPMGRTANRLKRSDFLAADVAAAALTGLTK